MEHWADIRSIERISCFMFNAANALDREITSRSFAGGFPVAIYWKAELTSSFWEIFVPPLLLLLLHTALSTRLTKKAKVSFAVM